MNHNSDFTSQEFVDDNEIVKVDLLIYDKLQIMRQA